MSRARHANVGDERHGALAGKKFCHPFDCDASCYELRSRFVAVSPFPDQLTGVGLALDESVTRICRPCEHGVLFERGDKLIHRALRSWRGDGLDVELDADLLADEDAAGLEG